MSNKDLFKIDFDYRKEYLFAHVTGERDSLEISVMFWTDILTELKEKKYKKVLVTEDFRNSVSTLEMFLLAEEVSKMGFSDIKIAFADAKLDQLEINKFGETVATKRGVYGRVFADVKEAEKWLLEDID